jgi:hypothetical protein
VDRAFRYTPGKVDRAGADLDDRPAEMAADHRAAQQEYSQPTDEQING